MSCEGFVLTGGRSSRMGQDKALLPFGDTTLAVWMARRLKEVCGTVSLVGSPSRYAALNVPVVEDIFPGGGPLAGIHAALVHSHAPWNLVVGCDMPYLSREFLEKLLEVAKSSHPDAVVPESESFGYEPLCAVYSSACREPIEKALQAGQRKISDVFPRLRLRPLRRPEWQPYDLQGTLFRNLNTMEEYNRARAELRVGGPERSRGAKSAGPVHVEPLH